MKANISESEYNERLVPIELSGTTYFLNFSTGAAKKLTKVFGAMAKVADVLDESAGKAEPDGDTADKPAGEDIDMEALTEIFTVLIQQGAIYIKEVHKKDAPTLTAEAFDAVSNVGEIPMLIEQMSKAIELGSGQTIQAEPKKAKAGPKQ